MDGNEFKSRFMPYIDLIFNISFAITGDREDAEDIVQEVYEKLWNSRESLSKIQNDQGYIAVVTKNMALDRYRRKTKLHTIPLSNVNEARENDFFENKIEQEEMLNNIRKLLYTLPQSQQIAIKLRHFSDLSISQIADIMQITRENVRQLLSRARRTIKVKIEQYYEN